MLDCIFHEEMFTYFILDAIYWDNQDLKALTVNMSHVVRKMLISEYDKEMPESRIIAYLWQQEQGTQK